MAKTRKYRKSIRINGELIQQRFFTKKAADEWYAKEQKKKERVESGLDVPVTRDESVVSLKINAFKEDRVCDRFRSRDIDEISNRYTVTES